MPRQACRAAYVDVRNALGPQHGNVNLRHVHLHVQLYPFRVGLVGAALGVRGVDPAGNPAKGVDRLAHYGLKSVTVAAEEREAVRRQARHVEGERRLIAEGEGIGAQIQRRQTLGPRGRRGLVGGGDIQVTRFDALIACQCDPPGVL